MASSLYLPNLRKLYCKHFIFDYKVQLCNLRGDSMSVSKPVTLVNAIMQLIAYLSLLISSEI